MDRVINQWNQAAMSYSEFEATSRYSGYCREFASRHFQDIKNKKVLDAGCGNGEYTHILAQNGGIVTACDGSCEMLRLAREKYPQYQFDKANLLEKLPYGNQEFDLVYCNLVLMDIDPIDGVLAEFHRILKTNGIFFFSIVHPAFYFADWDKNAQGVIISKNVKEYITPFPKLQNNWGGTMLFHRPVSYYYNKIAASGFCLKEMFEPSVYEEAKIPDIPLYLFTEFLKIDPH